MGSAFDFKKKR